MFGDVAFAQTPFAALGGATFASSLSEAATGSSTIEFTFRAGALIQEASTAADIYSVYGLMVASRSEAATALATPNFTASTLTATQAENATALATQTAIGTMLATQVEAAAALATPSAITTVLALIAEAAAGASTTDRGILVTVTVNEAATGASTQTARVVFQGSVQEAASGAATQSVLKTVNAYPAGIQLNVYVGQVLVWGTIPTGQTPPAPDWTDIPT